MYGGSGRPAQFSLTGPRIADRFVTGGIGRGVRRMRHGITVFCYGWGLGSGQRAASKQQKQRRTEQNSQRQGERGEGEGTGEQANIRQRLWSTAAWDEARREMGILAHSHELVLSGAATMTTSPDQPSINR